MYPCPTLLLNPVAEITGTAIRADKSSLLSEVWDIIRNVAKRHVDCSPVMSVEIAPDIEHWHGAAPDSWFSHLAIGCNPQTNKNIWLERVDDRQYAEATKDNGGTGLSATDPELDAIFGNFTKEVQQYGNLDTKTRLMVTLASNIASQAQTEYRMMLESALNAGITPIEIKEILYQAVAYAGMAKVMDFVGITNEALLAHGVRLPLEGQAVVSAETRFDKGLALQKSIFGERIDQMHKNAPENQKHIQRYLSANCFGDYQTRGGLDVKTRELLTFSILVSLGGCESQVKGHIQGNVNVGNNKDTLLAVVTQLLALHRLSTYSQRYSLPE